MANFEKLAGCSRRLNTSRFVKGKQVIEKPIPKGKTVMSDEFLNVLNAWRPKNGKSYLQTLFLSFPFSL